jgi:signal transduction histidine kinase
MFKEAEELYRFKDDIFHIFLPILGIFTIIIILGNYALSGWLFDPFKRILKQMASYTIGKGNIEEPIKTSTKEFHQLKTLYRDLRSRIENDYFQLKEYTENMSHELQTPLSVIQNKTEVLLSDENLNYDHALKLKIIYDEVQQLSKLSSSLNLLTKIENNEFQNIQTIPTAPVIRNHINKIREFADMKELKIEAELNEQHTFTIDPSLLDILIRNLLRNALRYSETSSTIHIITDAIKLQIINTGDQTDFPSEDIFNRFQKNKNHNSLGLGLAIVKKICTVNKLDISYNFSNRNHIFTIR